MARDVSANRVAHPHDLHHGARRRGRARCARPPARGRHRRRRAHEALAHGRSTAGPMKLLREGPTSTGWSRTESSSQRRQHLQAVGGGLGEPDAGVDDHPPRDAGGLGARQPGPAPRSPPPSRPGRRARGACDGNRRGGASARGHAPARDHPREPRLEGKPLTSLTRSAPGIEGGGGHRRLAGVDGDEPGPRRRSPSMTGTTRRISRLPVPGPRPGRVDSPPTSTMSAPASNRRGRGHRGVRPAKRPPSEKESGVTLSTPMTQVLSPRTGCGPRAGAR